MAKVKVVGTRLNGNLNRENFNNTPSQTIFSFGRFSMTSNFDGRQFVDYTNELTSFVKPITLETLNLSDVQSDIILNKTNHVVLNLDKSDFKSFVRFGSAYEFLRTAVEDIILKYPASIYVTSSNVRGGNNTIFNLQHDESTNITLFNINLDAVVNDYGIKYTNNIINPDENEIRNINLSYSKYVIWVNVNDEIIKVPIIGFTGDSQNITVQTLGNPFEEFENEQNISFHIKPNNLVFEEFREQLTDFQKYMLSNRVNNEGFEFIMKDPILTDSGNINYNDNLMVWSTPDGYNLDFSSSDYRQFLERLLIIGNKYDTIKTDLIARFLSPSSIKTYDLTEEGKITKLLRVYGREFDQMREFVDSLAHINRITYDKINNAPDQIIANLAKTMGWDYFSLVNEAELVETLLTIDGEERNLNNDLLPVEIDIELWRRIIINTNYFWKTKGTREVIKSMFLMIGIPEPFINITEYVYTVNGRIDPRQIQLQPIEFGSETYPFDDDGYPIAPPETPTFYFQLSGNTDNGQAYMDNFRKAGFKLEKTIDNKKSWVQAGEIIRMNPLSPEYYQANSKLVLNTKEVDVALDTARGVEYDVFEYIKQDWEINSTGATVPYSYVNISLDVSNNQNTFPLPANYDSNKVRGDLEVRFNGILLNPPKEYDPDTNITITGATAEVDADYTIDYGSKTFTLITTSATTSNSHRDVIQATFIYSGDTTPITGVSVQYVVTRIVRRSNQIIKLPSDAKGHVQLTINGIALTRGTSQFNADYTVNPNDKSELVIQNQSLNDYLNNVPNSFIQVAYVEVSGSTSIEARSEIYRVDSFNSSKFYFNSLANRFVYVMNYRAKSAENIKVLVDGIALEPKKDYIVNVNNSYEIYLPKDIKFGSVISVYYLIGGDEFLDPVIEDLFGLGDISELSFLQFIELIERKMINARTRKTITDFKGGWYPTLLRIYIEYLKRAELENDNPLQSNGYTFQNLFPFLRKYNTFFDRFIKQLLPATVITKRSGLLVRNSLFSRQKFPYKRGVAYIVNDSGSSKPTVTFNSELNYIGDDGSIFLIPQEASVISPSLETRPASSTTTDGIIDTGGIDIVMWNAVTSFGMEYREKNSDTWIEAELFDDSLTNNSFTTTIQDLDPDTEYEYRAFIDINSDRYYGNVLEARTDETIIEPFVDTKVGEADVNSINNTGGINIVRADDVESFGMKYRVKGSSTWIYQPNPPYITTSGSGNGFGASTGFIVDDEFSHNLTGLDPDTEYEYRAFIVVDGIEVVGLIEETETLPIPFVEPDVETGNVLSGSVTTSDFIVEENKVLDKGNPDIITRYGLVWTQTQSFSDQLVLGAPSSIVFRKEEPYNINVNDNFSINVTGLSENTRTWFRAFADNGEEIGYGETKSIVTDETPEPDPERNLTFEIVVDDTDYTIYGTFAIRNANDNTIIENVNIPSPTSYYTNLFVIPDVDYYIDGSGLAMFDSGFNNVQIQGYSWDSYDPGFQNPTNIGNGDTSPTLINEFEYIRLTLTP
ncbi:MAG: hypothetical protein ACOC22_00240 [bacterium]